MVGQARALPATADVSGRQLGKYSLVRRLAVGGMAEIFLAKVQAIHGFEKLLVLKRILPQFAEDAEFVAMFLDEARLAANLHHPNIVQVYDIGEHAGAVFFTMEYVHGQDLRGLVRRASPRGRVPLEHVINIAAGTAAGLHHAHEQIGPDGRALGIVHRDVSPSNVLVTYSGAVKLVDFGIAKATSHHNATQAGTLKGKIPYMSPEQCRSEPLDRRSDVFSLGVVLWELSTGTRLFREDTEFATLQRIATQDAPPPSATVPDYPPELERIVMRALARDRNDRYATAEALQVDLEDFAREHKLAVSAVRLGGFMRDLFAEDLAAEAAAARVQPDVYTKSLATDDLQFISSQLLAHEEEPTRQISDSEMRRVGSDTAVAVPTTIEPSGPLVVPASRRWLPAAILGGAIVTAAVVVAVATSGGGSTQTDMPADPTPDAAPADTTKTTTPTPTDDGLSSAGPPAAPPPEPEPGAAPAAEPEVPPPTAPPPESDPVKPSKKPKPRKKTKKKAKKASSPDWDKNSAFPPPG